MLIFSSYIIVENIGERRSENGGQRSASREQSLESGDQMTARSEQRTTSSEQRTASRENSSPAESASTSKNRRQLEVPESPEPVRESTPLQEDESFPVIQRPSQGNTALIKQGMYHFADILCPCFSS